MVPFNELAESGEQQTAISPDEKHQEVDDSRNAGDRRESDAARTLQRTYRGHRERRQLKGITLDPATRWTEAIKEAQYRSLTTPRPRSASTQTENNLRRTSSEAHQHWLRVAKIARRAGGVDEDVNYSSSDESETPSQKQARHEKRLEEKQERIKGSKMMDLQYFLEMVDLKHRYGSNLRKIPGAQSQPEPLTHGRTSGTYHAEWKRQSTLENFFYWLDYGEGKDISLPTCPRDRLDREQVRYLSREERLHYLACVDKEGKLCWKRNGQRIDTSVEWKDSVDGIVPVGDTTPGYSPASAEATRSSDSSGDESGDEEDSSGADARKERYVNQDLKESKGPKKLLHVSPGTIFNQLLRTSVRKNTWIFVADTSFNLYIGIKQSGSFQHSSFLHGSRISAAGLIKIKDGTRSAMANPAVVQPRSGHYRPPSSNFRAFMRTLEDRGVDMSSMTVSKSYAVLLGLEGYAKTRKKLKDVGKFFGKGKDDGEIGGVRSGRKEPKKEDRKGTEKSGEVGGMVGEDMVLARR
ncbi:hypothetical protein MMC29_008298 [Sticta canariensis]|nr:hypothetical protein [Sticta canariensis]